MLLSIQVLSLTLACHTLASLALHVINTPSVSMTEQCRHQKSCAEVPGGFDCPSNAEYETDKIKLVKGISLPNRLESDVDMLKAEVQSMQAALKHGTQCQGIRQSLRTAERLSREGPQASAKRSVSQSNSAMAAHTPDRVLESRFANRRQAMQCIK